MKCRCECRAVFSLCLPVAFRLLPRNLSVVTKADIVDRIAEGTGLTKLETEAVVDGFVITVMEALEAGDSVELRGFGSFRVRERAPRVARNPQTDEPIDVPRQFVPAFKPSQEFRRVVNAARIAAEDAAATGK